MKSLYVLTLTAALGAANAGTVLAAGFTLGSIDGQEGWSGGTIPINPSVDQEVTGAEANTGAQSFRISNKAYNGNFSGWVFGPGLSVAGGQPDMGGADRMLMTLFFRSVSNVADGSSMELDFGTVAGDDRNNFIAIRNVDAAGVRLDVAEPQPPTNGFYPTNTVATGLTTATWHRLDVLASFFNGASNDYFQVFLDDPTLASPINSPNHPGNPNWFTFESYRDGNGFPYALQNRLFMRSGAAPSAFGFPDANVGGFYIDDVTYKTFNSSAPGVTLAEYSTSFEAASPVPEPSTLVQLSVGLVALLAIRRVAS